MRRFWTAAILAAALAAPALAAPPSGPTPAPGARAPQVERAARTAAAAEARLRRAMRVDRMFRLADRNRDGVVSRAEYLQWYRTAARRRGPLTWRRHATNLYTQLNVARNGRLTQAEFAADPSFRRTRPGWFARGGTSGSDRDAAGSDIESGAN